MSLLAALSVIFMHSLCEDPGGGACQPKACLVYELKECDRKEMTDVSKEHRFFFFLFQLCFV